MSTSTGRININVLFYPTGSARPIINSTAVNYTSLEAPMNALTNILFSDSMVGYIPISVPQEVTVSNDVARELPLVGENLGELAVSDE